MRFGVIGVWLLMLAPFPSCVVYANNLINCDVNSIIPAVLRKLEAIGDCQSDVILKFNGLDITSRVVGKKPANLRIQQSIQTPENNVDYLVVFDGTTQWIETRTKGSVQAMKLKIAAFTHKDRPFDTGYYLNGTGLLTGEDYIGTIVNLLNFYNLKSGCNKNYATLSGMIIDEKFSNYAVNIKTRRSEPDSVRRYIDEFGYLEIIVDTENWVVNSYKLGQDKDNIRIQVRFKNTQFDKLRNNKIFRYEPPQGIQVLDITDDIINELK